MPKTPTLCIFKDSGAYALAPFAVLIIVDNWAIFTAILDLEQPVNIQAEMHCLQKLLGPELVIVRAVLDLVAEKSPC